jgi:GTP diphosphokinase / guanosine-3',5'-bis(diphosphate) 3'-diphosphatase
MDLQSFFDMIRITRPLEEYERVRDAYRVAADSHKNQTRDSGDEFIIHPRRVATQLVEHGYTQTSILIGGLLHDVLEERDVPKHVIVSAFGEMMWEWMCTLTNVTLRHDPHSGMVIERIQKRVDDYFGSIAGACFEVRIIKLADRLDNLIDTKPWSSAQISAYIAETRMYVTPIALSTSPCFEEKIRHRCNQLESEFPLSLPSPSR